MKSKRNWQAGLTATIFTLALVAIAGALASSAGNAQPSGSMAPISTNPLPIGTILPGRVGNTPSLGEAQAGQVIEAKIMQEVPLPNRGKIHLRSRVSGTILSIVKDREGVGVQLELQFNKIEYDKQVISVVTSLRAVASYEAVRAAQMSFGGADGGTPVGWADTVQIGGDTRFRGGGEGGNRQKEKVGKGAIGGGAR